jgi:hypothetical protein
MLMELKQNSEIPGRCRSVGDISGFAEDREITIYGIVNIIRKRVELTSWHF